MKSVALIVLVATVYAAFLINESSGRRTWVAGRTNTTVTCNQTFTVPRDPQQVVTGNLTVGANSTLGGIQVLDFTPSTHPMRVRIAQGGVGSTNATLAFTSYRDGAINATVLCFA